ncbi:MAG: MATE family efflux transporter [Spirochaetes bacterium]|nr:MATE family efflux transporter [Spirochaetota bacterium]
MNFASYISRLIPGRFRHEGGYRDLIVIAFPLFISTGSWAIQHFVDRMYLNWYSSEAVAASMPSGILNFAICSLFMGTAGYVSTFVAQYYGADRKRMIGPVLWQGLYISVVAGVLIFFVSPFSDEIFTLVGHSPGVQGLESIYFKTLCYGGMPLVASSAMSGYFSGLGRTGIIMAANIAATLVNVIVDYLLIFGYYGFPEMGIQGAAVATVTSSCVSFVIYALCIFRRAADEEYHTVRGWRLNPELLRRLIRFGLPNGIQFFLDIAGMTFFVLFIGRLGTVSLAATNIAFNINTVAFMPMIGLGIAVSVLVGQYQGRRRPDLAEYSVWSGFHLTVLYMGTIAVLYLVVPGIFLAPYAARANPAEFSAIADLARMLLRFVALYSVFDAMNIIFASAIKGAGDTRFVMRAIILLSLFVLVIPSYLVLFVLDLGIYAGWTIVSLYVIMLGLIFFIRFLRGQWKSMRVIEESHAVIPPSMPEGPAGVIEI